MISLKSFKQQLAAVSGHWNNEEYGAALAEVEALREVWPGNAHLLVLWAGLVQLGDDPRLTLDQAKRALRRAGELDPSSPAAAIELGHFLDAVDDDPRAAARVFAAGVATARRLLAEGLIGRAKALLQLGKREEAFGCAMETVQVMQFDVDADRRPSGRASGKPSNDPLRDSLEALVEEVFAGRSA